jgi:hypothetical protein
LDGACNELTASYAADQFHQEQLAKFGARDERSSRCRLPQALVPVGIKPSIAQEALE